MAIDRARAQFDAVTVLTIVQLVQSVDVANLLDYHREVEAGLDNDHLEVILALEEFELKLIAIYFARLSGPIPGQGDTDAGQPLPDPRDSPGL